jgi:hypothetical protein
MPEQIPLKDPRFKGKRYEIKLEENDPGLNQQSVEACAEKIASAESLMTGFENTFNLDELRAIKGFTSKEEREQSPRRAAVQALLPIFAELKYLGSQENVPNDVYEKLKDRYRILNRAVGATTTDPSGEMSYLIDHTR